MWRDPDLPRLRISLSRYDRLKSPNPCSSFRNRGSGLIQRKLCLCCHVLHLRSHDEVQRQIEQTDLRFGSNFAKTICRIVGLGSWKPQFFGRQIFAVCLIPRCLKSHTKGNRNTSFRGLDALGNLRSARDAAAGSDEKPVMQYRRIQKVIYGFRRGPRHQSVALSPGPAVTAVAQRLPRDVHLKDRSLFCNQRYVTANFSPRLELMQRKFFISGKAMQCCVLGTWV